MPEVNSIDGVAAAQVATIEAMASGDLTPDEAVTVTRVLDAKRKTIETQEIETRLSTLERKVKNG